ncbi:type II methionyl aminopeptidase [archaeon]|nr:type II methionyl aminopeptidase [archaeon]
MEKSEIDSYKKAGAIAKQIKTFTKDLIKPKMKLLDIAEAIDSKILELGGEFAFPVNLSMNEIAAHYTPASGDETLAEGILKVDVGVAIDGFIADTALSIDLTENKEFKEMIELNQKLLENISKIIKVGMEVQNVGESCQKTLEEWDKEKFSIIKSLSGHSLAQNTIHAGLTISNYKNTNKKVLDEIAFAIEPFVTTGVGDIYEGEPGGIYILKNDGQTRDRDARKVLEFVREEYGTRPFCARWLAKEGFDKLKFVLKILVKQGILYEYPMLIEKSRKPVSQFENTFVLANGEVVCTTG